MKYQIGELVITPAGIGTVEGCVRLRGRIFTLMSTLPEELIGMDAQIHGFGQLVMVPEESVKKYEEEG